MTSLASALSAAEQRIAELEVLGCTGPDADNYDCAANVDDGSCEDSGCTDPDSIDFDPEADVDDGSCLSVPDGYTLAGENEQGYDEYTQGETGIVFVFLPGGDFEMGSPEGERNRLTREGPVHTVTSSPFLIAKHELTVAQYAQVMAGHPDLDAPRRGAPAMTCRWNRFPGMISRPATASSSAPGLICPRRRSGSTRHVVGRARCIASAMSVTGPRATPVQRPMTSCGGAATATRGAWSSGASAIQCCYAARERRLARTANTQTITFAGEGTEFEEKTSRNVSRFVINLAGIVGVRVSEANFKARGGGRDGSGSEGFRSAPRVSSVSVRGKPSVASGTQSPGESSGSIFR